MQDQPKRAATIIISTTLTLKLMSRMTDLGMNGRAWALADRLVDRATDLRIAVHTLANGARVVDAGVGVAGGLGAGAGPGGTGGGRPGGAAVAPPTDWGRGGPRGAVGGRPPR